MHIMKKFKTDETFRKEIADKFPSIEVLSEYKSANENVTFRCKIHDYVFSKKPIYLQHSACGCNKCAEDRKKVGKLKSDWDFAKELAEKNTTVEKVGVYTGADNKLTVKCKICGNIWNARPADLLRGHGCGKCGRISTHAKKTKTHEQFLNDVKMYNVHFDSLEFISPYHGIEKEITCRCKKCGYEWKNTAGHFVDKGGGVGCPLCRKSRSKGELAAVKYFIENSIDYIEEYKFSDLTGVGGLPLSFDFYIPSNNLLIEIQGKQHYESIPIFGSDEDFAIRKEHDNRKRIYANMNGYSLLEIPYVQGRNLDKIYDTLRNALS